MIGEMLADPANDLRKLADRLAREQSASVKSGSGGLTPATAQFSEERILARLIDMTPRIEAERVAAEAARVLAIQFERTREKLLLFDSVGTTLEALSVSGTQLSTSMDNSFSLLRGQSRISPTIAKVSTFDITKAPDVEALNAEVRALGAGLGEGGDKLAEDFIAVSKVFKNLGPQLNDVVEGSVDVMRETFLRDEESRRVISEKIAAEAGGLNRPEEISRLEKERARIAPGVKPQQEFFA